MKPEVRAAHEAFVRAVIETHENPAEWPIAARRIAEAAGLRPERHIPMGGSLLATCYELVKAATDGANKGGLELLLEVIATYARGVWRQAAVAKAEWETATPSKKAIVLDQLRHLAETCDRHGDGPELAHAYRTAADVLS